MKKKWSVLFFVMLFFALLSDLSLACDFCLLSQGISPLETISGSGGIRINQRYTLLNTVYSGTKEVSLATNPKEDFWTTEVTGFYSISEGFMLLAILPIRKNTMDGHLHVHSDGDIEVHPDKGEVSGMGDIAFLGRYTFFKTHTIDTTTAVAALFGVKLPTGRTDGKTSDGANFLDAHIQLGTGSTDFFLGLSFNHAIQKFSISANILNAIHTEGKAGDKTYQFGNILNYDVTTKYRIYPALFDPEKNQCFLAFGINGELKDKEKEDGITITNSGGHTIYLTPGVQVVMAPHWVVEASYFYAIYHDLYETQTGENYKVSGGVTYLF